MATPSQYTTVGGDSSPTPQSSSQPREKRWPNNLTDDEFDAICATLNFDGFIRDLRHELAAQRLSDVDQEAGAA